MRLDGDRGTMRITQESFEDFLKCPRKSHLVSEGAVGLESEIQDWQRRLQEDYKEAASAHLRSSLEANEWYVGTPPLARLKEHLYRLILDYAVAEPEVHARLQGLELDRSRSRPRIHSYIPVRFLPKKKLQLSSGCSWPLSFSLSRTTGKLSSVGKIVHGCRYSSTKVALARLHRKVRSVIEKMISAGRLVHADETKVSVGGNERYVWVFTSLKDVAFVYSETREASTVQDVLRTFRGVLVSDFYAAYDSLGCAQLKCLIHLMRDVNEDLVSSRSMKK